LKNIFVLCGGLVYCPHILQNSCNLKEKKAVKKGQIILG